MKYIITADWHLQYSIPICRTDNFIETQKNKLIELEKIRKEHDAIIIDGGDTTNKAREDKQNEFINNFYPVFPNNVYGTGGNHSLLFHKTSFLKSSTLGVLDTLGVFNLLNKPTKIEKDLIYGFNFDEEIQHPKKISENGLTIAVWHHYISKENDSLNKFINGYDALQLLIDYPEYDLICTGDNHQQIIIEHEGRLLVNPGSLCRLTTNQINYKPSVILFDSETKKYEQIFLPIEEGVISRDHIDEEKAKQNRFEAFVKSASSDYNIEFSFENNIKNYLLQNKEEQSVQDYIYESMEVK